MFRIWTTFPLQPMFRIWTTFPLQPMFRICVRTFSAGIRYFFFAQSILTNVLCFSGSGSARICLRDTGTGTSWIRIRTKDADPDPGDMYCTVKTKVEEQKLGFYFLRFAMFSFTYIFLSRESRSKWSLMLNWIRIRNTANMCRPSTSAYLEVKTLRTEVRIVSPRLHHQIKLLSQRWGSLLLPPVTLHLQEKLPS